MAKKPEETERDEFVGEDKVERLGEVVIDLTTFADQRSEVMRQTPPTSRVIVGGDLPTLDVPRAMEELGF